MAQCCINPSILSADFVNLEAELRRISNADAVHVDVMDNHFVPNLTLGLPVVKRIAEVSPVPLDTPAVVRAIAPGGDVDLDDTRSDVQLWPHVHGTDAMHLTLLRRTA